jgi:hypothetical protein
MKNVILNLAVSGALALSAGSACAEVVVNYVHPERFADLPSAGQEREQILKELTSHFAKLGAQLPQGQTLLVDVEDIDMAGREIPGTSTKTSRAVSSVDWPRIQLQFEIESNGQIVRSGKVELRDMAFSGRATRYFNGDALRFEKRLLDEWFYATVLPSERSARR